MLRRLAQHNHAATNTGTPVKRDTKDNGSPMFRQSAPSTPPSTPRNRMSIGAYRSPVMGPSLSASVPFDWDAARSHAPPPYTPLNRKLRKSLAATATDSPRTEMRRAVVRKKSLFQKIKDLPSSIAFHLAMFPHNLPLPEPKTSSRILGGGMHLAQFSLRVSQAWDEEDLVDVWWDWATMLTFLLVAAAFANAAYLFSRKRKYHFHRRADPIASPNAKFVPKDWDEVRAPSKPLWRRTLAFSWWAFISSWRFLLNIPPPPASAGTNGNPKARVQELDIWFPGELELQLFSIYSPVHALLWLGTASSNWIMMMFSMGLLTILLNFLIFTYQTLIKDKETIAAEVMSEYNEAFVYPKVNPIKHDVGVMTHQSEMVSAW
ncbi:hypothetical protein BKA70DRAFT_20519 [Coprinopsis sp. MPI-PUGE-AT-0042]|nr:hypothetical protein BKA70DRAFT_20519 [Coprinopsis sp. MPI-PUGE-AT-0042]